MCVFYFVMRKSLPCPMNAEKKGELYECVIITLQVAFCVFVCVSHLPHIMRHILVGTVPEDIDGVTDCNSNVTRLPFCKRRDPVKRVRGRRNLETRVWRGQHER